MTLLKKPGFSAAHWDDRRLMTQNRLVRRVSARKNLVFWPFCPTDKQLPPFFQRSRYTQGAHGGGWIMGLPTPTLAFTLTHLTNYVWYTVAVEGWDGSDGVLMRSNLAVVMPTDRTIYVPVILRQHQ
jgi:hypothetical protein